MCFARVLVTNEFSFCPKTSFFNAKMCFVKRIRQKNQSFGRENHFSTQKCTFLVDNGITIFIELNRFSHFVIYQINGEILHLITDFVPSKLPEQDIQNDGECSTGKQKHWICCWIVRIFGDSKSFRTTSNPTSICSAGKIMHMATKEATNLCYILSYKDIFTAQVEDGKNGAWFVSDFSIFLINYLRCFCWVQPQKQHTKQIPMWWRQLKQ